MTNDNTITRVYHIYATIVGTNDDSLLAAQIEGNILQNKSATEINYRFDLSMEVDKDACASDDIMNGLLVNTSNKIARAISGEVYSGTGIALFTPLLMTMLISFTATELEDTPLEEALDKFSKIMATPTNTTDSDSISMPPNNTTH